MDRRSTVLALLALGAAPFTAEAQQATKVARIGYLANNPATSPYLRETFLQGLRDLGYVEGRNLVIEYRDAEGKVERLPALAAELVALKVGDRPCRCSTSGVINGQTVAATVALGGGRSSAVQ